MEKTPKRQRGHSIGIEVDRRSDQALTAERSIFDTCTPLLRVLRVLMAVLALSLYWGVPDGAAADDWHELTSELRIGGSARFRYEHKSDFKFGAERPGNNEDYFLTQFRLNAHWTPTDWLGLYIEGQDSRIMGERGINEDATPNVFADSFDVHQAYVDLKLPLWEVPTRLRVGRQKLNLGAQRLMGALEWVNTARVLDGVRITLGIHKDRTLEAFATRLVAVDPNHANDWESTGSRLFSSDFHGLYYTDWKLIPYTKVAGYGLLRRASGFGDEVYTLGGRFVTKLGAWDFDGELPAQFGTYGGVNHQAFALHVGGGYTWQSFYHARLGMAYNFASGNSSNGRNHTTFDNLFPTNHAHYGYMDFFSWQNMHNFEVTWQMKIYKKLAVRLAYHAFFLAEEDDDAWYNASTGKLRQAGGQNVDSYVGSEVDVTLKYPLSVWGTKIALEWGYGHFFTGAYVRDTGSSTEPDFMYMQTKFTF